MERGISVPKAVRLLLGRRETGERREINESGGEVEVEAEEKKGDSSLILVHLVIHYSAVCNPSMH